MTFRKYGPLNLVLFLIVFFSSLAWAVETPKEIRPITELGGIIVAPKEERKQALSQGDMIFVGVEKTRQVKKGDILEIFQLTSLPVEENKPLWFSKAGQVIILEIINERLFLCTIESSTKEIAVGDKIYFPDH